MVKFLSCVIFFLFSNTAFSSHFQNFYKSEQTCQKSDISFSSSELSHLENDIVFFPIAAAILHVGKTAVATLPDYILGLIFQMLTGVPYAGLDVAADFLINLFPGLGELRTSKKIVKLTNLMHEFLKLDKLPNISGVVKIYDGVFTKFHDMVRVVKDIIFDGSLPEYEKLKMIRGAFDKVIGAAFELRVVEYLSKGLKKGEHLLVAPGPSELGMFVRRGMSHFILEKRMREQLKHFPELAYNNAAELRRFSSTLSGEAADFFIMKSKGLVIGETKVGGMFVGLKHISEASLRSQRSLVNKIILASALKSEGVAVDGVRYVFNNAKIGDEFLESIQTYAQRVGVNVEFHFLN